MGEEAGQADRRQSRVGQRRESEHGKPPEFQIRGRRSTKQKPPEQLFSPFPLVHNTVCAHEKNNHPTNE